MRDNQTVNKLRTVAYVAKGFATGLTDLVLVVRKPNGSALAPAATFSEQSGGVYIATYTPDVTGVWEEKITSVTNGDKVVVGYNVVSFDSDDVKSDTATILTDVVTIDGKVDTLTTKSDAIKTVVDEVAVDTDTLITDVGAVKTELDTVNSNVSAIKTKTDNLPADTATELSNIKNAVDAINLDTATGGYIL